MRPHEVVALPVVVRGTERAAGPAACRSAEHERAEHERREHERAACLLPPGPQRHAFTVPDRRPLRAAAGVPPGQTGAVLQSSSVTVTDSMTTRSLGVPDGLPSASISCTTSEPRTTEPNSEYWGGSRAPSGPLTMKN